MYPQPAHGKMRAMEEKTSIRCAGCGDERPAKPTREGDAKLPRGWRRTPDASPYCPTCWDARYVLRAITVPVAGPAEGSWEDLRDALRAAFEASTAAANVTIQALARADAVRTPDLERLPPCPTPYLYPVVREAVPGLDPQSATALIRAIEGKYRAIRYDVLWLRKAAWPTFRYPYPYPVHNQAWGLSVSSGGDMLLSVRFQAQRRLLRLRSGPHFRRQRRALELAIAGEAIRGELTLYEVGAHPGDHRSNGSGRSRLMAKMVLWLPKREAQAASGSMLVEGTPESFLVASIPGSGVRWVLNGDRIRQQVVGYDRSRQRRAEDLKHEKRWPRRRREAFLRAGQEAATRQRHRLSSYCHEVSHMLAERARRAKVAEVVLDLSRARFVAPFPWHELVEKLRYKLEERSIVLSIAASGPVAPPDAEVLAEP